MLFASLLVASCEGSAPVEKAAAPAPAHTSEQNAVVATGDFTLPLPEGYRDISSEVQKKEAHLVVVFEANRLHKGYRPTIAVRKVPIPGGSFADPATCAETGKGLLTGGMEAAGTEGTLKRAAIIDGPVGKACQIHLLAPEGIALITELHRPGNTPSTPQDIWLMTCNHADGDEDAEATCRSTLAGFRFRDR